MDLVWALLGESLFFYYFNKNGSTWPVTPYYGTEPFKLKESDNKWLHRQYIYMWGGDDCGGCYTSLMRASVGMCGCASVRRELHACVSLVRSRAKHVRIDGARINDHQHKRMGMPPTKSHQSPGCCIAQKWRLRTWDLCRCIRLLSLVWMVAASVFPSSQSKGLDKLPLQQTEVVPVGECKCPLGMLCRQDLRLVRTR
jgi:hypothetical protein